jgi:hypothetical protein
MNKPTVTCPISKDKINENVARVSAFFTIIITLGGLYFKSPLVLSALAIDFSLRAFTSGNYSPLKYISKKVSNIFGFSQKLVDAAPKKFAAALGAIFSISIAALLLFQLTLSAEALSAILLICAALESFKGFCVGCIIYTYILLPFLSKDISEQTTISINL